MPQVRYLGYVAVVIAVLLHLYSANPDTEVVHRVLINLAALVFAMGGFWSVISTPRSSSGA